MIKKRSGEKIEWERMRESGRSGETETRYACKIRLPPDSPYEIDKPI